jgi:hypothetical protein
MGSLWLVACLCAAIFFESVSGYHEAPSPREIVCGRDEDCVKIQLLNGEIFTVSPVDFTRETALHIFSRIPSWFGPHPGVLWTLSAVQMDWYEPLHKYSLALGETIQLLAPGESPASAKAKADKAAQQQQQQQEQRQQQQQQNQQQQRQGSNSNSQQRTTEAPVDEINAEDRTPSRPGRDDDGIKDEFVHDYL